MTENTDNPIENKAQAQIGIVCALKLELAAFLDRCERVNKYTGGKYTFRGGMYDDIRVAVVESGTGFSRARKATQALVDAHSPDWILSAGFSGALQPDMQVGHIVVADSIVDTHGHETILDMNMPADPDHGLHVGRLVTADALVRTVDEKQTLAADTQGLAVDLESLAVAQVARETKTRFLAVRVISDDMSADLPPEVVAILGRTGSIRAGAVAGSLWKRPSSAKDMWRLRENANVAAEKLATFLDGVVRQLATV